MTSLNNYSALETDRLKTNTTNDFNLFDSDELTGPAPSGSLYTAAVVTTIGVTLDDMSTLGGALKSFLAIAPSWFLLMFNFVSSITMVFYLKQIRDETPECEANFPLIILGVVIFNIYNVGELFESLDLLFWIVGFKTSTTHEPLTLGKEEDETVIVSGLTPWYKFVCLVFVVMPKMFLGLLLAHYGSGFLLVSDDNESLILNTVALTFITQIDELIYDSMTPANVKVIIDELPTYKISYGAKILGLARPYIVSAAITAITFASYADSCGFAADDTPVPTTPPKTAPPKHSKGGRFF